MNNQRMAAVKLKSNCPLHAGPSLLPLSMMKGKSPREAHALHECEKERVGWGDVRVLLDLMSKCSFSYTDVC